MLQAFCGDAGAGIPGRKMVDRDAHGACEQRNDRSPARARHLTRTELAGHWRPLGARQGFAIETSLYLPFDRPHTAALRAAAQRFGRFLRQPVLDI
jgi:hypothetical protein